MTDCCVPRGGAKTISRRQLREQRDNLMSYITKMIVGFIGTALLVIFVGELSRSISSGFAGFWGGFPFMVIVIIVCALAIYDYWDECIRKKD